VAIAKAEDRLDVEHRRPGHERHHPHAPVDCRPGRVEQAGADHVAADEAAVEPLVVGQTLCGGDEHAIAVGADQLDAGSEPAASRPWTR
jgi:hypothetical protein